MGKAAEFKAGKRVIPYLFLHCALLALFPQQGYPAKDSELNVFTMSLEELTNLEVVTASLQAEKLSDAIATTHVITGEQIKDIGARTIYDALVLVPGLTLSGNKGGAKKIFWRGVGSQFSSQHTLLMDNHVLNDPISGGTTGSFIDKIAVGNIDRIEVVHGAGSSLFGGNAFLGMINIITRKGADIDGVEASISSEYDHRGHALTYYNYLMGAAIGNGWEATLNLHGLQGDGVERWQNKDRLGQNGAVDTTENGQTIDLHLANETFLLHGNYRSNQSSGHFGGLYILNDGTWFDSTHAFIDADWTLYSSPDLDLKLLGGVDRWWMDWNYELIPGFLNTSAGIDILAYQSELRGTYTGFSNHSIISGFSARHEKAWNPYLSRNGTVVPDNWLTPTHRNILAAYINDNVQLTDSLAATLNARYDYYSDTGGSFSPRLGLRWQLTPDYTIRAIGGTAFRAPDFGALGARNNSLTQSNPDLEPEEITTYELGINATPLSDLLLQATLFHYDIDELISPNTDTPQKWENAESLTSQGVELVVRYDWGRHIQLSANYTLADLRHAPNYTQPSVPKHSGSVAMDYRFNQKYRLNLNSFWQGSAERIEGDTRDDLEGYVVINGTFKVALSQHLSLQVSVYNLLNKEYAYAAYPVSATGPPLNLPAYANDFTAAGRSILLGMTLEL